SYPAFFFTGQWIMIESPLIQELIAEVRQQFLVRVLTVRFGTVPAEVCSALQTVTEDADLDELIGLAACCPNLDAFPARLSLLAVCPTFVDLPFLSQAPNPADRA